MARRRSSKKRRKFAGLLRLGFLLAAAIAVGLYFSPPKDLRRWLSEREGMARVEGHAELIRSAAVESGLDPNLLAGVMMVESRGHLAAESKAGALGLFQLMLPTAADQARLMGLKPPSKQELLTNGVLNARLGAGYLAWLHPRFDGELERALIAYNTGPGRLKRLILEAGSYAAWRDARERAGDSKLLSYARDVEHYRQRFADRGAIAPTAQQAPSVPAADDGRGSGLDGVPAAPGRIGPLESNPKQ